MAEIQLDVSELEPCEPLEITLQTISTLKPGDWIRVYHRREPFPLYTLLKQQDFCWQTQTGKNHPFEILIWRCNDTQAESALKHLES